MSTARRRLPFGAELVDGERTRFRLWAPDAAQVELVRMGEPVLAMTRDADGWHALTCAAPAGTRYRYRIDGEVEVPDPAARAQEGGIDGASIVVDAAAYAWQEFAWQGRPWEQAVLYELHVGVYGGFDGVRAELAALAALGVTAIELMPIAQFSGSRNWGYDGVLPFAPAAVYGTPDELKQLIDAAHGYGLAIVLDVVYNHFGPRGNWLGRYASPFFDPSRHTPWGSALAFARPEVREFFLENALYWLHEFRVDGLRLDAANAIGDASFIEELCARAARPIDGAQRRWIVIENDDNDAPLIARTGAAQWNDDAHHLLHALLTDERDGYYADYADRPAVALARWLGQGFVFQGEAMAYRDGAPRGTPSAELPPTAFVTFLQNHDQIGNRAYGERIAALAGDADLDAAYALLLMCPQIPMLFMGEEWGSVQPFLYFTDYDGELGDAVREGRRSEFARFAGFGGGEIPDPNAVSTFTASRPDFEHRDTPRRRRIAALLALRAEHVMPRLAGARALGAAAIGTRAVDARWRMGDGRVLRIAANFGDEPCALAAPFAATVLETAAPGDPATLPAHACIVALETVPA